MILISTFSKRSTHIVKYIITKIENRNGIRDRKMKRIPLVWTQKGQLQTTMEVEVQFRKKCEQTVEATSSQFHLTIPNGINP